MLGLHGGSGRLFRAKLAHLLVYFLLLTGLFILLSFSNDILMFRHNFDLILEADVLLKNVTSRSDPRKKATLLKLDLGCMTKVNEHCNQLKLEHFGLERQVSSVEWSLANVYQITVRSDKSMLLDRNFRCKNCYV